MADEATIRRMLERYFEFVGADVERAEEFYHEDAVLEFPQSGERFVGRATFTEWRSQYPVAADEMRYRILRHTVRDDFAVTELTASYDRGENWMYGVQLLDFRDEKVIRERIYVAEGWEAPEWRAKWRSATPADPSASLCRPVRDGLFDRGPARSLAPAIPVRGYQSQWARRCSITPGPVDVRVAGTLSRST